MRNIVFVTLVFMALTGSLIADDYAVDITISPAQATVGDEIIITYSLTSLGAHSLRIDPLDEEATAYFIKEQKVLEERNLLGVPRLRRIVKLVPFETGVMVIPTTIVEVIDAAGKSTIGSAPTAIINVISVSPNEKGPEELKEAFGIIPLEEEDNSLLWIIIIAAGVAIAALFFWMLFRAKVPASLRKLSRLTPAERALEELNGLRKSDLLKKGLSKKFYTDLAFILKRYLGLRYHIMALEMTSAELSRELYPKWKDNDADINEFDGVMNVCDLTKFAKHVPETSQGVAWLDSGKQIVLDTRDDLGPEKEKGGKA